MTIIPAIDIIDGKCVRLTKGDYTQQTTYHENPLEAARLFEAAGLKRLHLVDLDGARSGSVQNWKVLESIATQTSLQVDFSGGLSTEEQVATAFNAGAAFTAIGSMAVKQEETVANWLLRFGPQRFLIGADVRDEKIVIRGWTEATSLTVFDLIGRYKLKGVKQFFCTDVNRDGLLAGPSTLLYKKILNEHPSIDLIASGGVTTIEDIEALRQARCEGVIIGKALYENRITMTDLKRFI